MKGTPTPGFFIVFEGPEGAGKTTQIERLASKLQEHRIEAIVTREPGGTPAGDAIRTVILDPDLSIQPLTEFLLYSASRAQHVAEVVKPALEADRIVVSDRFSGASVAYQGYGRGLALDFIHDLTERVTQGLKPDLVLLLDLEPERGLWRIAKRGLDRLERAEIAFHRRVREGFLVQAEANPHWHVLSADQPPGRLAELVWEVVAARLLERTR